MVENESHSEFANSSPISTEMDEHCFLEQMWGNLNGEIDIFYPAIDEKQWRLELESIYKDLQLQDIEWIEKVKANQSSDIFKLMSSDISKQISKIGTHITAADIYGAQHLQLILSLKYGHECVKLRDAHHVDENKIEKIFQEKNLILIGGPSGNPLTQFFLEKTKNTSIFPKAPDNDFEIRLGDKTFWPNDNPSNVLLSKIKKDYGVFIKMTNPFNSSKKIFAAMGACSWGTQGAASLACSYDGIKMLYETNEEVFGNEKEPLIGCVKVTRKLDAENSNLSFENHTEPSLELQLQFPKKLNERVYNPGSVLYTHARELLGINNVDEAKSEIITNEIENFDEIYKIINQKTPSISWGRALAMLMFFAISIFSVSFFIKTPIIAVIEFLNISHMFQLIITGSLGLFSSYMTFYYFFRLPKR